MRSYMSHDANLAEVIRELDRAVLRLGASGGESLVWLELAGLVALLNFAAAFFMDGADLMEGYMQEKLGNGMVQECFDYIYANRADYMEAEEYRSEGCPGGKRGDLLERQNRRIRIFNSFNRMAPDVTDLRDGVQTVLFTLVWINETAFKGYDAAMSATLHVELLIFSASLQNLSGCELALFTSNGSGKRVKDSKGKRGKSKKGWNESVVSCPYALHLYTLAVANMAFETLQTSALAAKANLLTVEPEKGTPEKFKRVCRCSTGTMEEWALRTSGNLHNPLALVERKQYNWKPHMRALQSRKQRTGKVPIPAKTDADKLGGSSSQHKVEQWGRLSLADILRKRFDEFALLSMMPKAPDGPSSNGGMGSKLTDGARLAQTAQADTGVPRWQPTMSRSIVMSTKAAIPASSLYTATTVTTTTAMTTTATTSTKQPLPPPPPPPHVSVGLEDTFKSVFDKEISSNPKLKEAILGDVSDNDYQTLLTTLAALGNTPLPHPMMSDDELASCKVTMAERLGREHEARGQAVDSIGLLSFEA
ncbi:hypothetical protein EX895_001251 [Sporisorium graminicola]|uniref:Uncharacterized protein n=1 Tax=Sporisorium graminicola TaxID=280036 RepID=A0A4U7KYV9_9BASI|nr:hypothetical protein EX895_001251 [Sporisorium graminicola]TKY89953.1 hypothetical protein EX895_001251 [Sporisorium graminicola]